MAVQFIVGGSGTGKTTYIYHKMIEDSMKENHGPILFLLPEQSNMIAEQEMVKLHPRGGTMDISILSFSRLAFLVFDELGIKTRDILDDYGKSMLIMKVLKGLESQLVYYRDMITKQGFVDEMKSILSEFYQYQVTEEQLNKVMEGLNPDKSLYYKIQDLSLIMHAFETALQDKYMVAEQLLFLLKEVAGDSRLMKGAAVYFDGFTGFTPVQYSVIEEFMQIGCDLYFTVTMEEWILGKNDYKENELFALGKREVLHLSQLAQKHNCPILPHIGLETNYRLAGRDTLKHMEKHLFRFPSVVYEGMPQGVRFVSLDNREKEALFVAQTIKEYVMDKGYRYRDFAIVMGDVANTVGIWRQQMKLLDIPCFYDYSEALSRNPIALSVQQLFEVYQKDFSYDSVFALMKSGLLDMPGADMYDLENYVLQHGIRGYSLWKKSFRGNKKGLHRINEVRNLFMRKLEAVTPVFQKKKAKGREYTEAVYLFMVQHHMPEKLMEQADLFERKGLLREAKSYRQVYEKWIAVLDKTMDILGDEEIERETFSQMITSGIAGLRLGVIPSTLDQVVLGDVERTRLHDIRVLFVVGMNDGSLPKPAKDGSILKDKDRKLLKDFDITLAGDSMDLLLEEQYNFYLQVTQACETVIFTDCLSDDMGAEWKPSYYMNRLHSILPQIEVENGERILSKHLPRTEKQVAWDFATQMMNEAVEDASLYHIMEKRLTDTMEKIQQGYLYNNQAKHLDKELVKRIYGSHMVNSVSKLETYAGCAYQFFLKYGLKIYKRPEYKVESNNIGTILHGVMELFFKKIKEEKINLDTLSDQERDDIVKALTMEMAKEENDTIFDSSFRKKHQLDVLIRVARRSVANLCRHLSQGDMEPTYFEKNFSPEDNLDYIRMALDEDMRMELQGIIDRVDVKETEDTIYYKVIDYKSGSKDIDYLKMYEGKQLQLAVYMSVMQELLQRQYPLKKVIPTGMYYFRLQDLIVEETDEEKLEKKRIDESRLTGLVNEDEVCRTLMDHQTGQVSPVRYKQDGSLAAINSSLVSTDELKQISEFVRRKILETGNSIVHGQIVMNPEKGELTSPCNFCDYKSICRFEPGVGGNAYRIHPQIDEKEAKQRILDIGLEKGETQQ